jgi:hypothetical protein
LVFSDENIFDQSLLIYEIVLIASFALLASNVFIVCKMFLVSTVITDMFFFVTQAILMVCYYIFIRLVFLLSLFDEDADAYSEEGDSLFNFHATNIDDVILIEFCSYLTIMMVCFFFITLLPKCVISLYSTLLFNLILLLLLLPSAVLGLWFFIIPMEWFHFLFFVSLSVVGFNIFRFGVIIDYIYCFYRI